MLVGRPADQLRLTTTVPQPGPPQSGGLGLRAAVVLGISGILGAGVFTLTGVAAERTGTLLPMAFVAAGLAISLSAYSYAKWSAAFPSTGGPAEFIYLGFGRGGVAQALNLFQWVAYLLSTALQAAGFAAYASALTGWSHEGPTRAIAAVVVVVFAVANLLGLRALVRWQLFILLIEAVALGVLVFAGVLHGVSRPSTWQAPGGVGGFLAGAAILYVTLQGFAVITNAAPSFATPRRTVPRAVAISLAVVAIVYVIVGLMVVSALPAAEVTGAGGQLLADAAAAVAGTFGLITMCLAALLATAAAVNAAVFSSSRIGVDLAQHGALPKRTAGESDQPTTTMIVLVGAVVALLVIAFPLTAIGPMVSLSFLALYAVINVGHLRRHRQTGARRLPLVSAVAVNALLFGFLLVDVIRNGPVAPWVVLAAAMATCLVVGFLVSGRGGPPAH